MKPILKILRHNFKWIIPVSLLVGFALNRSRVYLNNLLMHKGYTNLLLNTVLICLFDLTIILLCLNLVAWFLKQLYRKRVRDNQQALDDKILEQQKVLFSNQDIPDFISINAAFDRIIESNGEDSEAIDMVLKFASRLNLSSPGWAEQPKSKSDKNVRGLTNEMGEVHIENSEEKPNQDEISSNKNRVGQYKVWRNLWIIFFQHYWKADPATATDPLDTLTGYAIIFNRRTMEQAGYGILEYRQQDIKGSPVLVLFIKLVTGDFKDLAIPYAVVRVK